MKMVYRGGSYPLLYLRGRGSFYRYSTIAKGNAYENYAKEQLEQMGMKLVQRGKTADKGIDLMGEWHAKDIYQKSILIPILGQCKHHEIKTGPKYIRELEGTLSQYDDQYIGIFVSHSGYTKGAIEHSMSRTSQYPLVLVVLNEEGIVSFVPNHIVQYRYPNLYVGRNLSQPTPQI